MANASVVHSTGGEEPSNIEYEELILETGDSGTPTRRNRLGWLSWPSCLPPIPAPSCPKTKSARIACIVVVTLCLLPCIWMFKVLSQTKKDAVDFKPAPFKEENRNWTFGLSPNSAAADDDALSMHQWRIGKALHEKNHSKTASAIADYFGDLVGLHDEEVREMMGDMIERHLKEDAPCPEWNLEFEGPAEYILCDCTGHAVKDAHAAMKQQNSGVAIRELAEKILKEHAVDKIHECNYVFAWSLLGMLYAQHGFDAGPHLYRDEGFLKAFHKMDAAYKATYATARKLPRTESFLEHISRQMKKGRSEMQYGIMDIITDALNRMHTIDNEATWLGRMQKAMDEELELRPLPTTPSPTTVSPPSASASIRTQTYIVLAIIVFFFILIPYRDYRNSFSHDDQTSPASQAAPVELPLNSLIDV